MRRSRLSSGAEADAVMGRCRRWLRRYVAIVCVLIVTISATQAAVRPDEEIANDALDVISSGNPTPHDGYLVVICRSERAKKLSTDTTLGPFVRQLAVVKASMAVVVAPAGYSDEPTYVVYFDGTKPIGLATFVATEQRATDADVAKAYRAISGPIEKQSRRAAFKAAALPLDQGGIDALRVVGWK